MKINRLERVQIIQTDIDSLWGFVSHPSNLALITPPDLGFTITSALPEKMHSGAIATYTVTPFKGLRFKWVAEITHVEESILFVDEQRFGPYRFWHHQHHFKEISKGIEMLDIVHYLLPLDPFSRVLAKNVSRRLSYIFDYRHDALEEIFNKPKSCNRL